ncbi:hypothetical protein F0266_13835 [Vibrio coralliilyticus]|nr:hypothetical protein [Vibrio coralliilyticus]
MANLPFAFGSQVKFVLRQLAETWLQWGGPSLFQLDSQCVAVLAHSLILVFMSQWVKYVAALRAH